MVNFEAIDELAIYYKELYQILSQQAMSQVESVKLVSRPVDITTFGESIEADCILRVTTHQWRPCLPCLFI